MSTKILHHLLFGLIWAISGSVISLIVVYVTYLQSHPELNIWHTAELDAEYRAADAYQILTLEAYLQQEERLFRQLQDEIYDRVQLRDRRLINRYSKGSLVDPTNAQPNWNRTYEWKSPAVRGAVLLLHGLSDGPYSLRSIGEFLHKQGFWVLGLRLPGHGTAPTGLVHTQWEDWAAATRLAARYLQNKVGADRPLIIVGYSAGAAVAVEHTLAGLEDEATPIPAGLILISPAIGVSSVAVLAKWQARLAVLPGLEKLAWQSIQPEYDPYKYNSFAVNAGDQMYQLTKAIGKRVDRLDTGSGITDVPPVLVFLSAVDATVLVQAVTDQLLKRLTPNSHALVLFDINRHAEAESLLKETPETLIQTLLGDGSLPFRLSLLTNASEETNDIVIIDQPAFSDTNTQTSTKLEWPLDVYSLSHVALPFPRDDPLYGADNGKANRFNLGTVELRGERGLLAIPADQLMRLRYNPFFSYLENRILAFISELNKR